MVISTVINHAETSTSSCDASGSIVFAGFLNAVNPSLAAGPSVLSSQSFGHVLPLGPKEAVPRAKEFKASSVTALATQLVKGRSDYFTKTFARRHLADFTFGFLTAPKRDTRIILKWMPEVLSASTVILGNFNRQLEILEGGHSFEEYCIPAKCALDARNALLDAVAANIKRITNSDKFEMFLAAADKLSGDEGTVVKRFYERLVNRKAEKGDNTNDLQSHYFMSANKTKDTNDLSKLPFYREARKKLPRKLDSMGILAQLRDHNAKVKKSRRVKGDFEPFVPMRKVLPALVDELAQAYAEAESQGLPRPKLNHLQNWHDFMDKYLEKSRSMRRQYNKLAERFAQLLAATEGVLETLKPQNKELEEKLAGVTNPAYTTVVKDYLQGAFRQRILANLKQTAQHKESRPVEIASNRVGPGMPRNNLYQTIIDKLALFKKHQHTLQNLTAPKLLYEEIVSDPDTRVWRLVAYMDQYSSNNQINISKFHTIKLQPASMMRLTNTRGAKSIETEPIDPSTEVGNFLQNSLTRVVDDKLEELFSRMTDDAANTVRGRRQRAELFKKLHSYLKEYVNEKENTEPLEWAVQQFCANNSQQLS